MPADRTGMRVTLEQIDQFSIAISDVLGALSALELLLCQFEDLQKSSPSAHAAWVVLACAQAHAARADDQVLRLVGWFDGVRGAWSQVGKPRSAGGVAGFCRRPA